MSAKFLTIFIISLTILFTVSVIVNLMEDQYQKGYAAGADSLSAKRVDGVCMQWLFQSDLETARRRVCAK
jgi:hypothetical protein